MVNYTNAECALAGLLSEGPMHPYQIEKEVELREMRYWTDLSMSSIYKLLRKMERDGNVRSENTTTDENRNRKTYSLTDQGRETLRETIKCSLVEPEIQRHPVNVALYFMGNLTPSEKISALEKYAAAVEERSGCYRKLEKYLVDLNCETEHISISQRLHEIHRAEAAWLKKLITMFREKHHE